MPQAASLPRRVKAVKRFTQLAKLPRIGYHSHMEKTPWTQSPWLTIWVRPRKAMRQLLFSGLERKQLALAGMAALAGFSLALDLATLFHLGDQLGFPTALLACALGGALLGLVALYGGGLLFCWTGTWINGWARPLEVRAAIAWSLTPSIWALLLWIPRLALLGTQVFSSAATQAGAGASPALAWLAMLRLILLVWGLALFLACLSEAHRFSIWSAYAAVFLGLLILTVLAVILVILLPLIFPGAF